MGDSLQVIARMEQENAYVDLNILDLIVICKFLPGDIFVYTN